MSNNEFDLLDKPQQDLLTKHLNLVIEINKDINLTRIDTVDSGMLLHIEDSLSALTEINASIPGAYIDLGSGGGYPGIPIAIATGRKTTLLDGRKKKVESLNKMIKELNLSDSVTAVHARIEEYSRLNKNKYSLVTARALAKLSVIFELASPLLKNGGSLICYKAAIEADELKNARRVQKQTGLEIKSIREFTLSDGETSRTIVLAQKVAKPSIALPRHDGYAQKKPL